jgi:hypothetical protein
MAILHLAQGEEHMTDREALKLALEAIQELRYSSSTFKSDKLSAEAITAIEEALVQPEQKYELVTYGEVWSSDGETWSRDGKVMDLAQSDQEPDYWLGYGLQAHTEKPFENASALYTTPQQRPWVGLTDEEIKEIVGPWGDAPVTGYTRKLFDQIEAKLKEKNT